MHSFFLLILLLVSNLNQPEAVVPKFNVIAFYTAENDLAHISFVEFEFVDVAG